ncbi:hypothetical protein CGRA01v4_13223 [Colletotrichum graminicola]|uniref:2-oxoadipate dioxygenase/decarboxylase n=1 Tax=Colletotrichum graminicola (strain M1.001 / M2 / FGSC 10212) TaxID=645133 RepID=E3QQI9_COLGM|nr:uncharacterized protein GLRG_08271 [Colletotrichum graminicola M1.001]EFQ33127.1 hypothetical protein GLRG_08271 [Colletotrichum graminicola M1.001]WDK21933.1 hypothetical protein CGRA01v4_13223 [Colletotrichum graminicola]
MSTGVVSALQPPPLGQPGPGSTYVDADTLRTAFALAMSAMYKSEVPLYGDLIQIVQRVNHEAQAKRLNGLDDAVFMEASTERLTLERHGAIRLGTPKELHTVRRIFAVLGMHPVGYYDLSVAGLPMHATCFRPISTKSLQRNPFRVFTTLLRPDLLTSGTARDVSLELLDKRNIFSDALIELLVAAENSPDGCLTSEQGEQFVSEALKTFSWQSIAAATYEQYNLLCNEHPVLADIACFGSSHINHLTPRALDITAAQQAMVAAGMAVKSRIEGPPVRRCPILLRQTSFLALEEKIRFAGTEEQDFVDSFHKARFGEIEERGAAVTPAGRQLYDELLNEAMETAQKTGKSNDPVAVDQLLEQAFQKYPDDWEELRSRGLIYSQYKCTHDAMTKMKNLSNLASMESSVFLDQLVSEGILKASPITYEDFLPFSAAGIFQSNLQKNSGGEPTVTTKMPVKSDMKAYENALQTEILDSNELYEQIQRNSLDRCAKELGVSLDMW